MPVPADARPSARRALIALIAAEAISALGSLMSAVALPWFVLATTGSPTRMGLVLAAESAPVLVLAVPSARAVARLGARGSLVACDAWWAAATAAVPVLHFAGGLSFGTLLALAFLAGVPWAAHVGSQGAAVAEMLDADERAVARASALLQTLSRLAYFAGPALGGVLLAAAGAPVVLLIDAGTFVVSLALVAAYVPRAAGPRAGAERAARGGGGWRHLWRDPWLRSVTAAQALSQAAFMGMTSAIPVLAFTAADHDPRTAGALLGAWGGGAMAGSLAALRAAPAAAPLRIASRAWAFQAAGLWVLVADRSPAVAAGALAVSGVANGLRVPPIAGATARRLAPETRGATLTAASTVILGAGFVGLLAAGPALDRAGALPVLVAVAGLQSAAAAVFGRAAPAAYARAPRGAPRRSATGTCPVSPRPAAAAGSSTPAPASSRPSS